MEISKLLNPTSESSDKVDRLLVRELPACVAAPRDFSKSFLVDSNGSIHLTPPRRTVPCGREEYWLQPRTEYLFGRPTHAQRLSTVRRERYRGPYHRDLKTLLQYSDQSDFHYIHKYAQAVQEWSRKVYDELHPYEHLRNPDCDVYEDMSVDPQAIRTEEEERRVQHYRASMARAAVEHSAATTEPSRTNKVKPFSTFSEHQSPVMDSGAEIVQPRAMAPYKTSVLNEQAPLLTV